MPPINQALKYLFLAFSNLFQLYLAFASTIYHDWFSPSFWVVAITAVVSIILITYFVCVVYERNPYE